jgi:hypothetical protein
MPTNLENLPSQELFRLLEFYRQEQERITIMINKISSSLYATSPPAGKIYYRSEIVKILNSATRSMSATEIGEIVIAKNVPAHEQNQYSKRKILVTVASVLNQLLREQNKFPGDKVLTRNKIDKEYQYSISLKTEEEIAA